ncbi:MAG: FtsQ-type POTRA domain-containing protein [Sandaracinus sp.]|nr:FtsQ-type POTRA domain-containing protein [Sandaracinus sp.]MCB9618920.1 FtsQ-type POTRA domain-containing protein [Sandaracinus sp.]MCB9633742.1 FtsQ-type POTRA domain-containing protein [Sandaracinus sp.]
MSAPPPRNVRVRARDEDEAPPRKRPRRKVEVRTPPAEPSRNRRRARPEPVSESLEMPADALAVTPLASVPPPSGRESVAPRFRGERFARALRVLTTVAKIAGVLLAIGGAVAVGRLTRDYVRTSPAFAIATIELEGRERLDEAEVLRAAGIALGTNVFELSPEDVRARLERHPWIARAEVERRLPGTFRLKVVERHAALVLALGPSLYLVDDEGKVFKEVAPGDPVDFPIVSGVERERFLRERAWRSALLGEIDGLLDDWRAAGLWRREPIAEIHVEADDGLTLHVGADAMEVRLGRAPFLPKLRKLRRVLDRLDAESSRALYVHLDNVRRPDRVVVRLREEPEVVLPREEPTELAEGPAQHG